MLGRANLGRAGKVYCVDVHRLCTTPAAGSALKELSSWLREGQRTGGYSHLLASTVSLRAAGPATALSHNCDIPLLAERRPNFREKLKGNN